MIRLARENGSLCALACFGLINTITYSCLLPLWEGFDEPFHFGYVQHFATTKELPRLGVTTISEEVWESLAIAPLSHVVRWHPLRTTFDEFYRLAAPQQEQQLDKLRHLPGLRGEPSAMPNYEAHQPPLAYVLLAPIEAAFSWLPITSRVLLLRLFAGISSVVLTVVGAAWLSRELRLTPPWREAAIFGVFCSQMYYATVAHVCNDWLAIPLLSWWIAAACGYVRMPTKLLGAQLGAITCAGLLTKAYFLALLPVAAVLLLWTIRRNRAALPPAAISALLVLLSAPWYARNLAVYGNVSGTQEASKGVTLPVVVVAAPSVPWLRSAASMARSSVWTGNSSFTSFSATYIHAYLLVLAGLFYLYGTRRRPFSAADWITVATVVVFIAAIAYATVSSFVFTSGDSLGASPWYMQVLLTPCLCLAFLGGQDGRRVGLYIGAIVGGIGVYLIVATYVVKLIPMYSGFPYGKVTLKTLVEWYGHVMNHQTVSVSLLPLSGVLVLMLPTVTFAVLLGYKVIRALLAGRPSL